MKTRVLARALLSLAIAGVAVGTATTDASADSDATHSSPLTCTTSPDVGNQPATWSSTVSDDHDPAAVGDAMTYRFVVPFAQAPTPVTASYRGGTVNYKIPTGLAVTSVSMQDPAGGTQFHATAAVQGPDIVVTTTANVPIDGTTYPTPDLIVHGTVLQAAAGPGVSWPIPHKVVADAYVNGFGTITATCTPDAPTTVIGTTVVPGANGAPTATDKTVGVSAGAPTAITLSGTDPNGDALTITVVTQPSHGTLTGTAPSVTYTSTAGYSGTDSFTFKVDDNHGGTDIGTITLNVASGPIVDHTPPTIVLTAPTHGAVYAPTDAIRATYTCADTTTTVATCIGTVPNGAAVNLAVGLHTFVVEATDAQGNRAQSLVSYRVINPTPVPQHYTGSAADTLAISCDKPLPQPPATLAVKVAAPTQVPVSGSIAMSAAPGQQSVPMLLSYTHLKYSLAAPSGATVTAALIVPGTGSANASSGATAAVVGGRAVLTVPGPIDGGTTAATNFTPPAMLVTMRSSGNAGAAITTKFEQFVFTRSGAGIPTPPPPLPPVSQTVTCPAAAPTPTLTTTHIIDVTPPKVTLTSPGHGSVYSMGQHVVVQFSCADTVSLRSCVGTKPKGSNLPTATSGTAKFLVDAIDRAGNHSQAFASYVVLANNTRYTARVDAAMYSQMQATAATYGLSVQDVPKAGVGLLLYLHGLTPKAPPTPIVPPPANNGAVSVVSTYSAVDKPAIDALANFYSVTGDQLHWVGAALLVYIHALSG